MKAYGISKGSDIYIYVYVPSEPTYASSSPAALLQLRWEAGPPFVRNPQLTGAANIPNHIQKVAVMPQVVCDGQVILIPQLCEGLRRHLGKGSSPSILTGPSRIV